MKRVPWFCRLRETRMTRANVADILCIGAQRSMTSWLHHALSVHPETWTFPNFSPLTSTTKEAHYWDRNRNHGETWYRVLMRPLRDELKSLDFTPEYAFMSDEQIADCKRLNPEAKVIYILRSPLHRAVSALRMHTMWDTNTASEGDYTLTYGPELLQRCERARLFKHGDYAGNAARWRAQYPDMLIVSYDDLVDDPLGQVLQLVSACDLDAATMSADERQRFEDRVGRVNWPTKRYPLTADCLEFLQGLVHQMTWEAESELGITFREDLSTLEVRA